MQLQARISIVRESEDSSFYHTSDLDEIKNLGLAFSGASYDEIKVGSTISVDQQNYVIKGIKVKIDSDTDNAYGVTVGRAGKTYPYNLKITLIVSD